jgi:hypothetical protein
MPVPRDRRVVAVDPSVAGRPAGAFWRVPPLYGSSSTVDAAGMIAAPLLAGFGVTLIGLVVSVNPEASSIRWPDLALALLVGSVLALLGSLQCAVWARQYVVTPSQIIEWYPELKTKGEFAEFRVARIREEQWRYVSLFKRWVERMRIAYHTGILLLLLAIGVTLVPREWSSWRLVALILCALGLAIEATWITGQRLPWKAARLRLFPNTGDIASDPEAQPGNYFGPPPAPG